MKRFVKCLCLILVLSILLANTAFAAENTTPRASYYFTRYTAYLYKVSNTQFQVWFDVLATGTMDELGVSTIEVQRSSDGVNWITMRTYSKGGYSQMTKANAAGYTNCVTYIGTSGYYYRAYVTFYAKNSSGEGARSMYTSAIYLSST